MLQRPAVWTGGTWIPSSWPSGDTAPTSRSPPKRSDTPNQQTALFAYQYTCCSSLRFLCVSLRIERDISWVEIFSCRLTLLLQRLLKTRRLRAGSARPHPYRNQVSSLRHRSASLLFPLTNTQSVCMNTMARQEWSLFHLIQSFLLNIKSQTGEISRPFAAMMAEFPQNILITPSTTAAAWELREALYLCPHLN